MNNQTDSKRLPYHAKHNLVIYLYFSHSYSGQYKSNNHITLSHIREPYDIWHIITI